MADPYRESAAAEARRVIARKSAGGLVFHIALALTGLATPVLAYYRGADYPALFVLAVVAFPAGFFALGRGIHAWFVPHTIELDARGLRFAWGEKTTCVPWLERLDREVPWSALVRIHTKTFSVNGWSSTSLVVTTSEGSFEVPDDRFDKSSHLVQRAILDFVERQRERPVGSTSAYVESCREQFETPRLLHASPWGMIGGFAFFIPFIAFPTWLATETPGAFTYAFAGLAIALFGGLGLLGLNLWWKHRVIELGPEALAIGSTLASAQRIPWDSIRIVRKDITNGKTEGLEIVQEDGTLTSVRGNYGYTLDELAEMIDPARHT